MGTCMLQRDLARDARRECDRPLGGQRASPQRVRWAAAVRSMIPRRMLTTIACVPPPRHLPWRRRGRRQNWTIASYLCESNLQCQTKTQHKLCCFSIRFFCKDMTVGISINCSQGPVKQQRASLMIQYCAPRSGLRRHAPSSSIIRPDQHELATAATFNCLSRALEGSFCMFPFASMFPSFRMTMARFDHDAKTERKSGSSKR